MATSLLSSLKIHLDQYGQYELIEQRLRHLSHLILALDGSKKSLEALISHLGWLRQNSLNAEERQSRLDAAIVALANRHLLIARNMLEPFTARANEHTHKRWSIESSYCLAKLHELNGHAEEAMRHYQRYALQAMQCVRTEISVDQRTANRPSQATPSVSAAKDDVEMSLPAKYRRAYRYLLSHMDCANLSVREIAEHVGVTERALQSVFRRHLGMTPIEVLRRCRVERIREDLLNNEENSLTILEAATRWGIRNRSTLVSSYRKYFSETPTDTLARRGRYSGSSPSLGTLGSSYAQAA
jgi:AraC-like DNA-binding protein